MSDEKNYNVLTTENGVPIKAWTMGYHWKTRRASSF
jgi:hypothetical protein